MNTTHTTEGNIPHEEITLSCGTTFLAPVAVQVIHKDKRKTSFVYEPKKNEFDELLFAMPGRRYMTRAQING